MQKMFVTLATVALATPALATISLDGRYDYSSATSNTQLNSNQNGVSGFLFNRLALMGTSALNDDTTVNARLNLLAFSKDSGATGVAGGAYDTTNANAVSKLSGVQPPASGLVLNGLPVTGTTDLVEYAEVVQKYNSQLSFKFGKLATAGFGGFESMSYVTEMYFASQAYMALNNFVGAAAVWKFMDTQTFEAYLLNNDNSADATRNAYNFVYRGTFGDFGVIANYGNIPEGNQTGTSNAITKNLMTLGVSYRLTDWSFAVDYDAYTNFGNTIAAAINNSGTTTVTGYNGLALGTNHNTTQNSVVATARYRMNNWTPWVKLESTSRSGYQSTPNSTSDASDSIFNWSVAAEYKKSDKSDWRYHIAYVNAATNYDSNSKYFLTYPGVANGTVGTTAGQQTNATVTAQYVFVGLRYAGDFLK